MNQPDVQRARSTTTRSRRRQDILAAARSLLDSYGVDGTSLSALAAEAGVVKSGIYRHFETREDALLAVLEEESSSFHLDLISGIGKLPVPAKIHQLAALYAATCANHPHFCMLLTHQATTLENNISAPRATRLKREQLAQQSPIIETLAQTLALHVDDAAFIALTLRGLVAGLWPLANPATAMSRALNATDLAPWQVDFERTLARAVEAIIVGVTSRAQT